MIAQIAYKIQTMMSQEESFSYCFNEKCSNSIVNVDRCSSVGIDIELALANNFNCAFCGAELISPIFNMMRESILDLIKNEQSNVILLDDDLTFHHFVKRLFNKDLVNAKYYTDGYAVLNQLTFNISYENTLPDIYS